MPHSLSVVLIVRNEGDVLENCLRSVAWADELIVMDSGSTDATVEIAESFHAKVIQSDTWPGFGEQRIRAQAHATGDYILQIDADEVLSPENIAGIKAVLETVPGNTVYRLPRADVFFGKTLKSGISSPVRLYPKRFGYNRNEVHESVVCDGSEIRTLPGVAEHHSFRDYRQVAQKRLRFADDWAHERFAKGKRIPFLSIPFRAAATFWVNYLLHGKIRDGFSGMLYCALMAQYTFNKYAILWTLHTLEKRKADRA